MSSPGLITTAGRILTARLLLGHATEGITHCAIGVGDATFTDPQNPPPPNVSQTTLIHEVARTRYYKRTFLLEDPNGPLVINSIRYVETAQETRTIGLFFRFEELEANGFTIREYGFFGGTVQYVPGHDNRYARGDLFHEVENPEGQVLNRGYLYEVKTIPDWNKTPDTRLELIGIIKI